MNLKEAYANGYRWFFFFLILFMSAQKNLANEYITVLRVFSVVHAWGIQ